MTAWICQALGGTRHAMGPRRAKYAIETDGHPQDVDARRWVCAVRTTIHYETRARKNVQPLIEWGVRAEPPRVQQYIRQQHHRSCGPPDDFNDQFQHRLSPGVL
jgi:hypothetical protein